MTGRDGPTIWSRVGLVLLLGLMLTVSATCGERDPPNAEATTDNRRPAETAVPAGKTPVAVANGVSLLPANTDEPADDADKNRTLPTGTPAAADDAPVDSANGDSLSPAVSPELAGAGDTPGVVNEDSPLPMETHEPAEDGDHIC